MKSIGAPSTLDLGHGADPINLIKVYSEIDHLERSLQKGLDNYPSTFFDRRDSRSSQLDGWPELPMVVENLEGWHVEAADATQVDDIEILGKIGIEDSDNIQQWYHKYFLGEMHANYVGIDREGTYFALSLIQKEDGKGRLGQRAILWRPGRIERLQLYDKEFSRKDLLQVFCVQPERIRDLTSSKVQRDLLLLEEQEGKSNMKMAVIYGGKGQTTDDEMMRNVDYSPHFQRLLNLLGDEIILKDWNRFRGGLDVKTNTTGTKSVFTTFAGYEIMYHVAPFLPYQANQTQQVERKRHTGNDIVNIIFIDDDDVEFDPKGFVSNFVHVYVIVKYDTGRDVWKVSIVTKDDVPPFGPALPAEGVFDTDSELRRFLLTKLINAERAAYQAPAFSKKNRRTMEVALKNLYEECTQDSKSGGFIRVLRKRSASIKSAGSTKGSRSPLTGSLRPSRSGKFERETMEDVEFINYGKILKAMHSGGTVNKSEVDESVWVQEMAVGNVPYEVQCGDFLGDDAYLGTGNGLFLINANTSGVLRMTTDKVDVRHVFTVRSEQAVLVLGRDTNSSFLSLINLQKDRRILREDKKPLPRNIDLIAVSDSRKLVEQETVVTVALAHGKEMIICSLKKKDDQPVLRVKSVVTSANSYKVIKFCGEDNKLVVGTDIGFSVLDIASGTTSVLLKSPDISIQPVSAVVLQYELVVCWNNKCAFYDYSGNRSREYEITFTAVPHTVVYAYPFIFGFMADFIEARTLLNGKLVKQINLPSSSVIATGDAIYLVNEDNTTQGTFNVQRFYHSEFMPGAAGSRLRDENFGERFRSSLGASC
eukprot:Clim_evm45s146 gene=Clim_evmTU45s146